mmetsp:Transcript_19001/g.56599  ORF Transcript_19001/g.56599 Transcript_19001/m.56599 type:complete len:241 (-) Transcript_19001:393-1115(-)
MVEQLPQRALDAHIDKVDDRQPGRRHCCFVGQLHALDPLHAEHTPAREVPVDARRTHTRHVGVELRKPLAVPALHDVIQLREQPASKLVNERHQRLRERRHVGIDDAHETAQQQHVDRDALADRRPLHLDRDPLATVQPPLVHLPQARGRDRLLADLRKHLTHRPAQLLLDHRKRDLVGEARQPVLQARQHLEVVARKQVRPRAQRLPDLDKRRAERAEQLAQLHRALARVGFQATERVI